MKIYKYKLESVKFGQVKEIQICGTEILSCGPQGADAFIWVKADKTDANYLARFIVFPTGEIICTAEEGIMKFIGTVILETGIVLHIFLESITKL